MRRLSLSAFLCATILAAPALRAQQLDVPIVIDCDQSQEQAACYSVGTVMGLDPNGDGFLAVRSGPGSDFRMIDKLVNGDRVMGITQQGPWVGLVYRDDRKGWAHGNWIGNWIP
ncbi:SH3 domain-containing protein [Jannaschia ovalis]|uniref:SH3 domain-containing protein n=1 Tax=Jannaschia ovalis TaxID=3038773 RepID=A0ABY8LDV8_9RHOB|nr:SH3 domain-containing protein [Jannaschia sp. GRR-S6-38]WGH78480.1 SH3 domain-containing protein [Jannaschia sp. GRR-S6-38]